MSKPAAGRMDFGTFGGIVVAGAGIAVGLWLDGGSLAQILQPTAALIVFGGTAGAVLVQFPMVEVRTAVVRLKQMIFGVPANPQALIDTLLAFALKARRGGLLALDPEVDSITDPFLKKSLMLAIDGVARNDLRTIMELDLDSREEHEEQSSRVFEAAGGFAPTIGIIGAVLGLIQVMQHLDNLNAVGRGIAVAFVATLYGVGLANLLLLPLAGKLKLRAREKQIEREIILEAIFGIIEGDTPRTLREKLGAYINQAAPQAREPRLAKVASR